MMAEWKHKGIAARAWLVRVFRMLVKTAGWCAMVMILLSFTDLPYYAYHGLGMTDHKLESAPDEIVVLGGAGMPSPDGLMRTYYGARAALAYPDAGVIIALPLNVNDEDSLYQLRLMKEELVNRGVEEHRIRFEPHGYNTHSQAENISRMHDSMQHQVSLLIVTSPEHMYRAVRCFEAEAFEDVGGLPAFELPVDEERLKDEDDPERLRVRHVNLRYNMWSYLHYELLVLREYCAIIYYWMMGWI